MWRSLSGAANRVRGLQNRIKRAQLPSEAANMVGLANLWDPCGAVQLAEQLQAVAHSVEERFSQLRLRSWHGWARAAVQGSAQAAHRWLKGPVGWAPDVLTGGPGSAPCGLQDRADRMMAEWREGPWKCDDPLLDVGSWPAVPQLSPITAEQVSKAVSSFKWGTATATDGWHPRHWGWLPQQGMQALAELLYRLECTACVPAVIANLAMVFLPKPMGGYRPIGLLVALLRVWGKVRHDQVMAWELEFADKSYSWGAKDKSATKAVWKQALAAEYARASGKAAGATLLDLEKAYELVRHVLLKDRLIKTQFPMAIARLAIVVFELERYVSIQGAASQCIRTATSIVAGASPATSMLRAP